MRRILFVDPHPETIRDCLELLSADGGEWHVDHVATLGEAWARVCQHPYDVVVQDTATPATRSGDLLSRVMSRNPETVRIVLTTQKDRDSVLRTLGGAHQYLAKPCPPRLLLDTVERAMGLRDVLANEQLRRLVSQMQSLPSMPSLYLELLNTLSGDDPPVEDVAKIISRDLGMCSKLLQLVNSAYFGLPQTLSNPMEAVIYLGVETVKALVLSLQIFALFQRVPVRGFSYEALWDHCWRCGALAKRLGVTARLPPGQVDQAFTAGLLHDIGKLILATGLPSAYQQVVELQSERMIPPWAAEGEVFGATHAETGAYLLGLWGLPTQVVQAVAWHHAPERSGEVVPSPILLVHLANVFDHEAVVSGDGRTVIEGPSMEHLKQLGVAHHLEAWRERALREPAMG
jgi:HD-like signal output (HDOD) protein